MERFAGSMSWHSIALHVIASAVREPPVLLFKICATVSLRIRTMQRSLAAGFFLGFALGYLA